MRDLLNRRQLSTLPGEGDRDVDTPDVTGKCDGSLAEAPSWYSSQ